ncbi:hypothetical protein AB833_14735 [Chromatiales bacterium (ex Bugula neritina AB1)]|nr:hypothetical protein AB833_14735 [Chromatiales bacterium (ex Bugula neritina AB1)]
MLDPIVKTIELPCSQQHAFDTFVTKVTNWWPLDKNSVSAMNGAVAKKVVIEPKAGGAVYEIGHDDTRHDWGSVAEYAPHSKLTLEWHIGLPAENASEVSVSFTALSDGKTEVRLTHSRWEAFGDKAADMRNGYDNGWVGVFENAYRDACTAN